LTYACFGAVDQGASIEALRNGGSVVGSRPTAFIGPNASDLGDLLVHTIALK
jgi:hypothetical protein